LLVHHVSDDRLAATRIDWESGEGTMLNSLKSYARATLFAGALFGAAAPLPVAQAQSSSVTLDMSSQDLSAALSRLATLADVQIVFDSRLVQGRTAPRLAGTYTIDAALAELLRNTGLQAVRLPSGGYTLQRTPAPAVRASGPDAAPDDGLDFSAEIVVTGTRIQRTTFTAPIPTTTITAEQIETSGFNTIDEVLLRTPAFASGLGSANSFLNGDGGAAFINLRGLGVNRSLVLVNGRRRVSGSNAGSAVDLNTIPSSQIERVDVVTGGASAVYGADAVSGVVNIITRTDFDGLELSGRYGVAAEGDGETVSATLYGGSAFADDRGAINFSISYNDQAGILPAQRDSARNNVVRVGNPANRGPNDGVPDSITVRDFRLPRVTDQANFFFSGTPYVVDNGRVRPVALGRVVIPGSLGATDGGEGRNDVEGRYLRTPIESLAVRADLTYAVTPSIDLFAEAEFASTDSREAGAIYRWDERPAFFNGRGPVRIQLDNPFLPADAAAFMRANALTELAIRKSLVPEFGGNGLVENQHDRTTHTIVAGLQGEFSNWQWDASYQYGELSNTITMENLLSASNFFAANDVVRDPATGAPVCRDPAARARGCVPFNIFAGERFTPAQLRFFGASRLQYAQNSLEVFSANLSGSAFALPAGPIKWAFGAEHRQETLHFRDDQAYLSGETFYRNLLSGRPSVDADFNVTEAYVEALAPLIRDVPFAQSLDLEGAVRFSDYSTIGSTTAWRVGANWAVTDALRLRSTVSQSVRAPNLFELFDPRGTIITTIVNPCTLARITNTPERTANCRRLGVPVGFNQDLDPLSAIVVTGGNPELTEETSQSLTMGAVLTFGARNRLSFSADYFSIEIEDAVSALTRDDILNRCIDSPNLSSAFCQRISFRPQAFVAELSQARINVGSLRTSGVDFGAQARLKALNLGELHFNLVGTYLLEREQQVVGADPTTVIIEDGEYIAPRLRLSLSSRFERDDWYLQVSNRFVSESVVDKQAQREAFDIYDIDSRLYTDLAVGYDLGPSTALFAGMNNVFDTEPPVSSFTYAGGSTFTGIGAPTTADYDNVGRFLFVGARLNF
jgi:outer membrane receptor protein involved in Fe transport